jgi:hypothetical protein
MIHFQIASRRFPLLAIHHKWLADRPAAGDAFRLACYFHCRDLGAVAGFHREPKFTLVVDLKLTAEEILAQFAKNTRYEVNRAMKEGVRFERETEREAFQKFFAEFSETKGRLPLEPRVLAAYWPQMQVTKALLGEEPMAMHSYLYDSPLRRAVLLHTASHFRAEADGPKRSLIGRANRCLHFQDMVHFQSQGAELYDFGGYAKDTTDPELEHINQFKSGFGGTLIEESTCTSLPLWFGRKLTERLGRKT